MSVTILLGVLVGILMGLTGAGGGILGVPVLVFGMGWTMQQAAPVALVAMAGAATIGTIEGLRHKLVRYRAATLMAAAGVLVTPLGVGVAQVLPQPWLLGAFAAIMLLVALRLLRRTAADARQESENPDAWARMNPATGRLDWTWATAAVMVAIGAATGLLTGALGVGGGFLMVPMLRRYTDISMHGIVATSLMVIALVSAGGVGAALLHGVLLPMPATVLFAAATAAGMLLGRVIGRRLAPARIQRSFALLLAAVAIGLLARAAVV
jgi:uncharacterized membrane protein YfcA